MFKQLTPYSNMGPETSSPFVMNVHGCGATRRMGFNDFYSQHAIYELLVNLQTYLLL